MRSQLSAPLFFLYTCLPLVSCVEFHMEHEAVHQTALWRRSAASLRQRVQVEVTAHDAQRVMNMSTALQDEKTEYIGSIGVGTDPNGEAQFNARVVFDTGSTNLWVASTLCKNYPCSERRHANYYDPKASLTQEPFVAMTKDLDIQFGTGELKGPLHVDTYRVGPMVVKHQPFAMIREMNGEVFASIPFEGILGLGFPSLSFGGITPFFDTVIKQKLLKNNEFAFFFHRDSSKPSALLWGGVDKDLYEGPIRMFPVVQPHYWALDLVDFKVGNTSMTDSGNGNPVKRLIVDSGTTYFTAPGALNDQIMKQIPGTDCNKANGYPPITFVLKGADGQKYDLQVSQETYMLQDGGNNCRPAFMALDVSHKYGPAMILGEVFMRHFFTVFSRGDGKLENAKIGFAPSKKDATPKVKPLKIQTSVLEHQEVVIDSEAQTEPIMRRDVRNHNP